MTRTDEEDRAALAEFTAILREHDPDALKLLSTALRLGARGDSQGFSSALAKLDVRLDRLHERLRAAEVQS